MLGLLKNRNFLSIAISIIIFLIVFLTSPFYDSINANIKSKSIHLKNQIQQNRGNIVSQQISVITIDEESLNNFGYPLPREHYKKVIENLNKAGANTIGLDVIFADKNTLNPEGDILLSDAIKNAGNIVLGGAIISKNIDGKSVKYIEKPLNIFGKYAASFGYFKPNILKSNGQAVSFHPVLNLYDDQGKEDYNHFSIALLKNYYRNIYKKDFSNINNQDEWYYKLRSNQKIPFKKKYAKDVLINYLHVEKERTKFTNFSFLDVYNNNFDQKKIQGDIVLVGFTAKGVKDVFNTPNGIEYGVFILGNILNTILTKNFLVYYNPVLEWLLIFFLIFVSAYFNLSKSGYVLIFSNIAISILFLLIFPLSILVFTSYLLNHIFELFLALLLSLALGNIAKYLIENRNKIRLSNALSEYVSSAIAKEILTNSGEINLDGEKKKLAIFFSDIEGFTTISEKFTPEMLVKFLRLYLTEMSHILLDNNGFINKYEGDAIMTLWGAFGDYDNGSYKACISALSQQEKLKQLNVLWKKEGFSELKVRIGLHCGEAIIGNIGAKGRKLEFTALGDSVNLASRLEGVNKYYGTYICASEDIYEENKDHFEFRYLDVIRVKGKEKAVHIYELLGKKGELSQKDILIREKFEKALAIYRKKDFEKAQEIFEKLLVAGDSVSKTYIERCKYYKKFLPSENWDYVWIMNAK